MPLARKIGPILASMGISVLLWLLVRNLDRTPAQYAVSVLYDYPEDTVVLVEREPQVTVWVRATKAKLRTLQPAELVVRVRNPDGRLGHDVVVLDTDDVEAPFGVDVERVSPAQFPVRYERRGTQQARVVPEIVGKVAAGYQVATELVTIRPAEVTVAGPESRLEEGLVVRTERVDVAGKSVDVKARGVSLILPAGLALQHGTRSAVDIDVPVRPIQVRRNLDDIPVEILAGDRVTSGPNPKRLRVTVEGPQLQVEAMPATAVRVTVDVSTLEPRAQDYQVEPTVELAEGACMGCSVVARSQARIDVSVRGIRKPKR